MAGRRRIEGGRIYSLDSSRLVPKSRCALHDACCADCRAEVCLGGYFRGASSLTYATATWSNLTITPELSLPLHPVCGQVALSDVRGSFTPSLRSNDWAPAILRNLRKRAIALMILVSSYIENIAKRGYRYARVRHPRTTRFPSKDHPWSRGATLHIPLPGCWLLPVRSLRRSFLWRRGPVRRQAIQNPSRSPETWHAGVLQIFNNVGKRIRRTCNRGSLCFAA